MTRALHSGIAVTLLLVLLPVCSCTYSGGWRTAAIGKGTTRIGPHHDLALVGDVAAIAFQEIYPDSHSTGIALQNASTGLKANRWIPVHLPTERHSAGVPHIALGDEYVYVVYGCGPSLRIASCGREQLVDDEQWQQLHWATDTIAADSGLIPWDAVVSAGVIYVVYADYDASTLTIAYAEIGGAALPGRWRTAAVCELGVSDPVTIDASLVLDGQLAVVYCQRQMGDHWDIVATYLRLTESRAEFEGQMVIASMDKRGHMSEAITVGHEAYVAYIDTARDELMLARRDAAAPNGDGTWSSETLASDVQDRAYLAAGLVDGTICIAYNSGDAIKLLSRPAAAAASGEAWVEETVDAAIEWRGFVNPRVTDIAGEPIITYHTMNPDVTVKVAMRK